MGVLLPARRPATSRAKSFGNFCVALFKLLRRCIFQLGKRLVKGLKELSGNSGR